MSEKRALPEFVREALAEPVRSGEPNADGASDDDALEGLEGLITELPDTPAPQVLERLMATVSRAPYRYGPFFTELCNLFDLPEERIQELLCDMQDRSRFQFSGLPGTKAFWIQGGPRVAGAETLFVEFAPGVRYPHHRHGGDESVLVLEGSYTDDSGNVYGPGDRHDMREGSEHSFQISENEACVAAAVIHGGFSFTNWPLRMIAKLVGR